VKDGSRAAFVEDGSGVRVAIPAAMRDDTDTVVALTFQ